MAIGDAQEWAKRFTSFDERFLERVAVVWPQCMAVLTPQHHEDSITVNLVDCLSKDEIVRRICHWIEFQFEPFGITASGARYSKGIIDLAVLFDWERDRYLAYECKRLNASGNATSQNKRAKKITNMKVHGKRRSARRKSLATDYVKEGMMRFMTEQYAEHLPVGCMLGYVLDGDLSFARISLNNAIGKQKNMLALSDGPTPLTTVQTIERFRTQHSRVSGSKIEILHALLPWTASV